MYLKIYINQNQVVYLFVFLLVNLALKKPTFEQYTYSSTKRKASNAVDGLKSNLEVNGGECSLSRSRRSATWWVNLTTVYSINNIRVYFTNGMFMYILLYLYETLLLYNRFSLPYVILTFPP